MEISIVFFRFFPLLLRLFLQRAGVSAVASARLFAAARFALLAASTEDLIPSKCGLHPEHSHPPLCGFPSVLPLPNSMLSTKSMYRDGPSFDKPIFPVPSAMSDSSAWEKG